MALPYVNTRDGSGVSVPTVGGVAIGISNSSYVGAGLPITQTFPVTSVSKINDSNNYPIKKTTAGAYNATHAIASTGTFLSTTKHLIYSYTTSLNGSAHTGIQFSQTKYPHDNRRIKAFGAKTSTAFTSGHLRFAGVANQRNPWSTQPGANSGQYTSSLNASNVAVDEAIFVTYKSVPGEFVYRISPMSGVLADYAAR